MCIRDSADTVAELADKLGLPQHSLESTISSFNNACPADTDNFHPTTLDGLSTKSIEPAKTNWARPVCDPPFYAYSLRPGVTFTYLGLKVDATARATSSHGLYDNVWAAGEIMAGSILGQGYLAGFGMTIGTVFGRIAGREAARHVC